MRGSIIKREGKRGTYYDVVFDLEPDPVTGRRRQKWIRGFRNKKEAQAVLAQGIADVERGTYLDPAKITTGEWLKEWLKERERKGLSPTTLRNYRMIVEKHLVPALGAIPLQKLQPLHLRDYYAREQESGRKDQKKVKGGLLSARTILHHHRVLHKALREAEKLGLISRNPADLVDPPKPQKRIPATLTLEEAERTLELVRGTYLYIPTLLAIATGARRGEIMGLRWEDVDLERGTVSIRQELLRVNREMVFWRPKTAGSARLVPIPPFVVRELKAHKKRQLEWKLAAGSAWQETGLVNTWEDGSLINPDTVSTQFSKRMREAGFAGVTFHGLRHTHATLLFTWNVHPKKVAERLGHSTTKLTLDNYSHATPTMQDEVVRLLEENLFRPERR